MMPLVRFLPSHLVALGADHFVSVFQSIAQGGKIITTTLKSVLGLTPPRQGKVILDGQEIQGQRSFDIATMGIGFVPEHPGIWLTHCHIQAHAEAGMMTTIDVKK